MRLSPPLEVIVTSEHLGTVDEAVMKAGSDTAFAMWSFDHPAFASCLHLFSQWSIRVNVLRIVRSEFVACLGSDRVGEADTPCLFPWLA